MKYRSDSSEQTKSEMKYEKEDLEFVHRKRKSDQKSYIVIHFTGYLKSWPTSKINITGDDDFDDSSNILSCLVAVGQIRTSFTQPSSVTSCSMNGSGNTTILSRPDLRPVEYMFRISLDGKLTFIDQATTVVLGYLPQELIGTSVYEVLSSGRPDQNGRNSQKRTEEVSSSCRAMTVFSPLTMTAQQQIALRKSTALVMSGKSILLGVFREEPNWAQGRIGRMIADEMSDTYRQSRSPTHVDSTNTDLQETQWAAKRLPGGSAQISHTQTLSTMRHSATATAAKGPNGISVPTRLEDQACETNSLLDSVIEEQSIEGESNTDDGDEAAMSMIMSLLEADGLGGPIDFNDLPWPL